MGVLARVCSILLDSDEPASICNSAVPRFRCCAVADDRRRSVVASLKSEFSVMEETDASRPQKSREQRQPRFRLGFGEMVPEGPNVVARWLFLHAISLRVPEALDA